jgi:small conductance mechanosensitive channel
VLVALLFLLIFWGIYRGIRRLVVGGMAKANVDSSIRDMLGSLIKWAVMGFGLVIAFNQIGIQITALLTGVSIIGLAIGFAAQETLSNFIAGIVIFWDKPFRVGDWISIDGQSGQVKRITFRSTRLLNGDGDMVVMPNTFMLAQRVANHSTNPINRVKVPVSIAYKESIDQAREVLLGLVQGDLRVCRSPAPSVGVAACADSSVDLSLSFWIEDESIRNTVASEYLEKAKKAMDQAGIEMPYPHLQVVLEETAAVQMLAGQAGRRVG